jgi:hypothetical protein
MPEMTKFYGLLLFTSFLAILALAKSTLCQSNSARLNGMVVDTTGAMIAGARITVRNTGTDLTQTALTNDSGNYGVSQLPGGKYTITVSRNGFRQIVQSGITLTVNQVATLNFTLHVGGQQETVTVTGSQELINQTTAALSTIVGEEAIKDLPLNGRDLSILVFRAPRVKSVLNTAVGILQTSDSFPNETGASSGGGRQGTTLYLLDGVPNMDTYIWLAAPFPNSDATQEFRVLTNNYEAQYGFAPGPVVSIGTKASTNESHDGAFEFVRNNDLNAGNYSPPAVDSLKRNQFGGYAGGPIRKDKIFIFENYMATRESYDSSTNTTYIPTPTTAMLNGDFSAVPTTLAAPFYTAPDGTPNQVDLALFRKAAVNIAGSTLPTGLGPATGRINYALANVKEHCCENASRRLSSLRETTHLRSQLHRVLHCAAKYHRRQHSGDHSTRDGPTLQRDNQPHLGFQSNPGE